MLSEQTPLLSDNANISNETISSQQDEASLAQPDDSSESLEFSNVSFRKLIRRFAVLVPGACLLVFATLVVIFFAVFPHPGLANWGILRFYLGPFTATVVAWTAAHSMSSPLSNIYFSSQWIGVLVCTTLSTFIAEMLRLGTLALVLLRDDPPGPKGQLPPLIPFCITFWSALGWAFVEVLVAICQGFYQLSVYRDLFAEPATYIPEGIEVTSPLPLTDSDIRISNGDPHRTPSLPNFLEEQLERMVHIRYLTELEDVYGLPIPDIPIFVTILQRIDSIFLSMGLTFLLASSLLPHHLRTGIIATFFAALSTHCFLSLLWTPKVLPRIGVHTAAYLSFLISIACIWLGLWQWGIVD